MITLDMLRKSAPKFITENAFNLESGILTLQVSLGTFSLTGKTVTAAFSPKLAETGVLTVTNGVIQIPINSTWVQAGENEIQLNIRTLTTLEQSPIMKWFVLDSILATTSPTMDQDLLAGMIANISDLIEITYICDSINMRLEGQFEGCSIKNSCYFYISKTKVVKKYSLIESNQFYREVNTFHFYIY